METDKRIAPRVSQDDWIGLLRRMHITWNSAIGREDLRGEACQFIFFK